ncbi:MAG: sel1 repeat family protein [Legionellales bacterium]|nr:sel1 repeat family protein [Legionellales bacterium]
MFLKWKMKSLRKKADAMYAKRKQDNVSDQEIQKEIKVHKKLVKIYQKIQYSKKYPYAGLLLQESYRVASSINDADSQYALSKILFDRGKFWQELQSTCYEANIHNKYIEDTFKEAFSFMQAAEEQGHAMATRLHGLAFIHGWGVEPNKEKGFKFIVDSIDQEGAWNKATQIFEELGLNKPEFFNSIMAIKNSQK